MIWKSAAARLAKVATCELWQLRARSVLCATASAAAAEQSCGPARGEMHIVLFVGHARFASAANPLRAGRD